MTIPAPPAEPRRSATRTDAAAWVRGGLAAALCGHALLAIWGGADRHGGLVVTVATLVGLAVALAGVARPPAAARLLRGLVLVGLPTGVLGWCAGFVVGLATGIYDFQWI